MPQPKIVFATSRSSVQRSIAATSIKKSWNEIPERDVTYLLLSVYLFTTELRMTHPLPEHSFKCRITVTFNGRRLTKSTFPCFYYNYYLVCNLAIHKLCALCGIFTAISVILTTENCNDLEIRVPDGSSTRCIESYTGEFLMCHFVLVINCTRGRIWYRLWDMAIDSLKYFKESMDMALDRSIVALFCDPFCV